MLFGAPYLSTSKKRIDAMLSLARLKETDVVYELGCGDGRIIRKISARGVKSAVGFEFSFPTFLFAYLKNFFAAARSKIKFRNFWKQDYSDADLLICFLLERTMMDFEKKIWPSLKKGTRVISNEFAMVNVEPSLKEGFVYLYVKK
jgi:SAM-dependent methyltransferase